MPKNKAAISATIDAEIEQTIEKIRTPEKEDRSFSKMVNILLREALIARGAITKTAKQK